MNRREREKVEREKYIKNEKKGERIGRKREEI